MKLTSLKQLGFLLKSPLLIDGPISGVEVDSRLVKKDTCFFAMPGAKVDGHHFLKNAKDLGASCLVVNNSYKGENFGIPMIYVENTLDALQNLSSKLLSARSSKIIAITGSVGKTTTKDFLTTILKEKYKVSKTPGNSNSQTGVPLTILNHTTGLEDFLVLEVGMTEAGQIAKLVDCIAPDAAILTHVALTHAENFYSLKEIFKEKSEILKHPKTKFAVINRDIENFDEIFKIGSCEKYSYSFLDKTADFYFDDFTIRNKQQFYPLTKGLHPYFGKHHYQDLMAAIGCAGKLGLSQDEIAAAEAKLALPEKRFEIVEKQGILFVNDSYNASEVSMKAAIESLPEASPKSSRVGVIGEMLELGKFSRICHQNIAKVAFLHLDSLYLLGKECLPIYEYWKENKKPVEFFLDRSELAQSLKNKLNRGDVCLLKGSRQNHLWEILEEF